MKCHEETGRTNVHCAITTERMAKKVKLKALRIGPSGQERWPVCSIQQASFLRNVERSTKTFSRIFYIYIDLRTYGYPV